MSTAVNTGRKAVVRRRTKTMTQAAAAQYKIAIKYILCGALLLLGIVFMAVFHEFAAAEQHPGSTK